MHILKESPFIQQYDLVADGLGITNDETREGNEMFYINFPVSET